MKQNITYIMEKLATIKRYNVNLMKMTLNSKNSLDKCTFPLEFGKWLKNF